MLFEVEQSQSSENEVLQEYIVEQILAEKNKYGKSFLIQGQRIFLVKWKDFPEDEATWEPQKNFRNSRAMIKAWELKKKTIAMAETPKKKIKPSQKKKSVDKITENSAQKSQKKAPISKEKAIKKYDLRRKNPDKKYHISASQRRNKAKNIKSSVKANQFIQLSQCKSQEYKNEIQVFDDKSLNLVTKSCEMIIPQNQEKQVGKRSSMLKQQNQKDNQYQRKEKQVIMSQQHLQLNSFLKVSHENLSKSLQNDSNNIQKNDIFTQKIQITEPKSIQNSEKSIDRAKIGTQLSEVMMNQQNQYTKQIKLVQKCLTNSDTQTQQTDELLTCAYPIEYIEQQLIKVKNTAYEHCLADIIDNENSPPASSVQFDSEMLHNLSHFYERKVIISVAEYSTQTQPLVFTSLSQEDMSHLESRSDVSQIGKSEIKKVLKIFKYNGLTCVQVELKNKQRLNVLHKKLKQLCCHVLLEYYEQYFMKNLN